MPEDTRSRLKQWLESGEAKLQPLSLPQRELWETSPVPAGDAANHICAFIRIRGAIADKDCVAALQKVVERQEVLRLSFLPGKQQPVQLIRSQGSAMMNFREVPSDRRSPEAIEEQVQEVFDAPFDMVRGPLYRIEVLRFGPDDIMMVFAIHHSIADGWTLGVFVQDLAAAYLSLKRGHADLPPVPLTAAAWEAIERAFWTPAEVERCVSFWRPRLAGAPRLWKRPAPSVGRLHRWVSHIPADLSAEVRALVRKTNATLFSTLLTAFQNTLAQWSKVDDIVVGSPVANRGKKATHETMGYFSGVVPLRGQVDRSRSFSDSVRAVHQETTDCFANAMPFVELARALGEQGSPSHNPIFDVRFALQNHPVPDIDLPGVSLHLRMRSTGTARFDLGCEVTEEGDQLEVVWLSRRTLFSQADIDDLHELYLTTLSEGCRSSEGRASVLIS